MDPITINLEGLTFGPSGYIIALTIVGTILGLISWWQIDASGRCLGVSTDDGDKKDMEGNSHLAIGIVSGLLGIAIVCLVLQMTYLMFQHALNGK